MVVITLRRDEASDCTRHDNIDMSIISKNAAPTACVGVHDSSCPPCKDQVPNTVIREASASPLPTGERGQG